MRSPGSPSAVISEIDGNVKYGGVVKGQRRVLIVPDDAHMEPKEYSIPRGVHVNVPEGERVRAGDALMDGPSNPHDILHVLGEKELQRCMVNEIQEVYRLQGVNINDKHIEVITRQMMRWVKIEDVGCSIARWNIWRSRKKRWIAEPMKGLARLEQRLVRRSSGAFTSEGGRHQRHGTHLFCAFSFAVDVKSLSLGGRCR